MSDARVGFSGLQITPSVDSINVVLVYSIVPSLVVSVSLPHSLGRFTGGLLATELGSVR